MSGYDKLVKVRPSLFRLGQLMQAKSK